jgi:serine/threonine-protein kinase
MKCPKCHFDNPSDSKFCKECGTQIIPLEEISVSQTKTFITPEIEFHVGSTFAGRYKIIGKLGEGGMGVVYKAEDTKLKRIVALKFLPPELTHIIEVKERFIREAQASAALDHPNICTVHEIDDFEGKTFISMAYVEGQSLRDKIESGPLEVNKSLEIAIQVAEGLQEAHKKGVVHRDIKSPNIMVTERDQAKIMDFGLARVAGGTLITKEPTIMGTVAYMSPEQARGEAVDHRTDIWSLGVVLYEMISGQLPFKGERETSVMYSIEHKEPKPLKSIQPDIPEELEQIVGKALTKNPGERYQKMDELLDDLYSISKGFVPPKIKAAIRRARLSKIKRTYLYAGIAGLSVLLIAAGIYLFIVRGKPINSIAVLPLENLSGDQEKEYFSDGITDALINELAKISALRVISRTSMMQYKKVRKSLREIARELNVDAVVEASVLTIGSKVQIRARLIKMPTEQNLWAQSYERDISNILVLQSEIARTIAEEINVKIKPEEKVRLASARKISPEVYELYLKGRYFWSRTTESAVKKSINYFQQAIEKDPMYAPAYAGLVDAYTILTQVGELPQAEYAQKAKEAAMKALEIDERMGEAHASLGLIKSGIDFDWVGAEREFQQAIQLSPNYAMAYVWYSQLLNLLGRHEEAITKIKLAQELDPLNSFISSNVVYRYYLARRYDQALEESKKLLDMFPNYWVHHWSRGHVYSAKRMYTKAIVEFQKAVDLSEGSLECLPDLGYAYAKLGRRDEAQKVLKKLEKESRQKYVPAIFFATVYTGLGENDLAFEWLEKAYLEHDWRVSWIAPDPVFDSLRDDPRFKALLKKMNLER